MQNILPQQENNNLKKGYQRRFLIVLCWSVFFASLISAVIFVPVYLIGNIKTDETAGKIETKPELLKEQQDTLAMPEKINAKAKLALSFRDLPKISEKIRFFKDGGEGITLSSFSYKSPDKILITGVSKTRDTLLSFDKKLKTADFVKSTEVPVGSFAKDSDLPFSITVTLK